MKKEVIIILEKNKNTILINNIASKVMQICQDYNISIFNNYLNVSINNNLEYAPVASKVMHSSNKRGLPRHPGSNLGGGASNV